MWWYFLGSIPGFVVTFILCFFMFMKEGYEFEDVDGERVAMWTLLSLLGSVAWPVIVIACVSIAIIFYLDMEVFNKKEDRHDAL